MDMAIDKSGHHRLAGQIDDLGSRGLHKSRDHICDAIIVNEDRYLIFRATGNAVQQSACVNDEVARLDHGSKKGGAQNGNAQ